MSEEDFYPCVGICQIDLDSGYCLGCGRPPVPSPAPSESAEATQTPDDPAKPLAE